MPHEGRRIEVTGIVQGVGFRPWVFRLASTHGIGGWVRNDDAGVTIEAFGTDAALEAFLEDLRRSPPPAAQIRSVLSVRVPARSVGTFEIVESARSADRHVSIPADLATCAECLAEVIDPANRRYRYVFTNCTNCGPRLTIATSVPYDRPHTTMIPFAMCEHCRAEYDSPTDRRFHAQPNACPTCGPRLWLTDLAGLETPAADPIRAAADLLRQGLIVAVKGLGGFHLACDATNEAAVARLRIRKRRDEKPFAVMVGRLAEADGLARLTDIERRVLTSIERPIVLVWQRAGNELAPNVAPGHASVGLMLPYTPLHHLLLADARRPLVMTSGNLADEPLVSDNDEAITRLGSVADSFLLHDRDIATRCDDSVVRVIGAKLTVLRRSRGYVPRGIAVIEPFSEPVLACGGLLKNAFCIGIGETAYLGPHIGDLDNLETYESYERAIEKFEHFLAVEPVVVAHDLHPGYLSTRYALGREQPLTIAVQHHHAHVASAMAEHGIEGPVIGVAFDGTGLGTDGTAWGGEVLLADYTRFERLATFRPIVLAGGDLAIRQVWRQALAMLDDACGGDAPIEGLPVFRNVPSSEIALVRQMIAGRVNTTPAHGVGRYFDAVGALVLGRSESRYEGQIALEWNLVADPADRAQYEFAIAKRDALFELDLRPAIRVIVSDTLAGHAPASISARFHNTLAAATADLVRAAIGQHGRLPVVLSGGCFQNARLVEGIVSELGPNVRVVLHESVPPGDGGLALGQAVVANAVVQSGSQVVPEGLCA
ncbi:MAG: carbamoyltransferase HypF [Acidobacteria bacterium]|nr:carbamoyltransferase HypF [Acidobacteriota bacterium]